MKTPHQSSASKGQQNGRSSGAHFAAARPRERQTVSKSGQKVGRFGTGEVVSCFACCRARPNRVQQCKGAFRVPCLFPSASSGHFWAPFPPTFRFLLRDTCQSSFQNSSDAPSKCPPCSSRFAPNLSLNFRVFPIFFRLFCHFFSTLCEHLGERMFPIQRSSSGSLSVGTF